MNIKKRKLTSFAVFCVSVIVITSFVFNSLVSNYNTFAEGTYFNLGTGAAFDSSNDAINFSQGRVWTIDQYGKYIWLTQERSGPTSYWAWSNDLGTNWSQSSESYGFLTRGSVAYDSINDVLHVVWAAVDSNDGLIYRRYGITRDGSSNITAIARIDSGTINLQLDTSSSNIIEQPSAIWVNDGSTDGLLVVTWSVIGTNFTEIRGSMRKLTMTSADGVAGNWQAIDNTGDTFGTDPPLVAADKFYTSNTTGGASSSLQVRGGSGARKDDIYVFVAENITGNVLAYRVIWSDVDSDWRGGIQSPVTVGTGVNDVSGYNLKYQLITKAVLDNNSDLLYIGWANYLGGGLGDSVNIAYLDATDSPSSTFTAYSTNGTHSYAPTLDIAYDNTLDQLYVSYVESTTNGSNGSIKYKTFDGTTFSSAVTFYTSPGGTGGADGSADIPILYQERTSNNRLLFAFRVNGALPPTGVNPHEIQWGYITLDTPTPTPTNIPTHTPTNTPSNTPTSTPTTVPAQPLTLNFVDVNGGSIRVGDTITAQITFTNSTGSTLTNLNISSIVPTNASYVLNSLQYGSGNAATGGSFINPTNTLTSILSGASLSNGSQLVLTYQVLINSGSTLSINSSLTSDQITTPILGAATSSVSGGLSDTGSPVIFSILLSLTIFIILIVLAFSRKLHLNLNQDIRLVLDKKSFHISKKSKYN